MKDSATNNGCILTGLDHLLQSYMYFTTHKTFRSSVGRWRHNPNVKITLIRSNGVQLVLVIYSKLANVVSKMLATLHVGRDTEENQQRSQRKDDQNHSGGPTVQH